MGNTPSSSLFMYNGIVSIPSEDKLIQCLRQHVHFWHKENKSVIIYAKHAQYWKKAIVDDYFWFTSPNAEFKELNPIDARGDSADVMVFINPIPDLVDETIKHLKSIEGRNVIQFNTNKNT